MTEGITTSSFDRNFAIDQAARTLLEALFSVRQAKSRWE
jgi:hypothetical protein